MSNQFTKIYAPIARLPLLRDFSQCQRESYDSRTPARNAKANESNSSDRTSRKPCKSQSLYSYSHLNFPSFPGIRTKITRETRQKERTKISPPWILTSSRFPGLLVPPPNPQPPADLREQDQKKKHITKLLERIQERRRRPPENSKDSSRFAPLRSAPLQSRGDPVPATST